MLFLFFLYVVAAWDQLAPQWGIAQSLMVYRSNWHHNGEKLKPYVLLTKEKILEACNSSPLLFSGPSYTKGFHKFSNRPVLKVSFAYICRETFILLSKLLTSWYIVYSTLTGDFSRKKM